MNIEHRTFNIEQEAGKRHRQVFGVDPSCAAFAPGRVEVLGNHTDYNEGFVLSAALEMGVCAVASPCLEQEIRLFASDIPGQWRIPLQPGYAPDAPDVSAYVGGMAHLLLDGKMPENGVCLTVHGNLPLGAGLSSSAALEIAAGLVLSKCFDRDPTPMELARMAQRAEHVYAGVQCGLLDQITSLFGQDGHLVLTDFRTLSIRTVPMPEKARWLICNTGVRHSLADSAFNERRERCEEAARELARLSGRSIPALRDVTPDLLSRWAKELDPIVARRAAHVVGENDRVLRGRAALESGDLEEFGRLMFESHESSIRNFENSCPELDGIVRAARETPGVFGARLSGGGFGGSVIVLVRAPAVDAVAESLVSAFHARFQRPLKVQAVFPSAGAHLTCMSGV